jgi:helicase
LERGVAYHNAGLPIALRQLIEKAVEKKAIKVICATTTLAEGVDLPFRITILAEWLQWRLDTKDQQIPFGPLKFRNIVGRSGRAGVFTEGDTIVFENVLGPSKFVDQQNRTASILSMMESPKQVESALEEEVNPSEYEARCSVISSNFLACIAELPDDEQPEKTFSQHLLAKSSLELLRKVRAEVLSGGEQAFATAASPLKLTPLGRAANESLLSPESCRQVMRVMHEVWVNLAFDEVCSHLLTNLAGIAEQTNADWKKAAANPRASRFVVKPDVLPQIIEMWRRYEPLPTMFGAIPALARSKSKVNVFDWLEGRAQSENWSNQFDKFADFAEAVLGKFLPMALDACARFSEVLPEHRLGAPWRQIRDLALAIVEGREMPTRPLPPSPPSGLLF